MKKLLLATLLLLLYLQTAIAQEKIAITVKPASIFIERGENKQVLNFDFLITSTSIDTLTLTKITVSITDKNNRVLYSRFLDNNGTAPSINLIPNREFNAPSTRIIFNPFTEFSLSIPLTKLTYEWVFTANNNTEIKISTSVTPQPYEQKAAYTFPLKGKIIVYDAHDFYSHHRRFDYEFAPIKSLGISANFMRYAYDFVILDDNNKQFKGDGTKDEDYFGLGKAIYAIAPGKVIYASNVHKDDKQFNIPEIANNALELYGNCIAIKHVNNTVSIYGHLKQNSLKVKVGDVVIPQQEIAAIGVSGSSFFPHLHFELRSSIKSSAEGFPSYFSNVYLLETGAAVKLKSGLVETGNIIEAK